MKHLMPHFWLLPMLNLDIISVGLCIMDGKCCTKEAMMLLWQKVVVEIPQTAIL